MRKVYPSEMKSMDLGDVFADYVSIEGSPSNSGSTDSQLNSSPRSEKNQEKEQKTNWRLLAAAGVVAFLTSIENTAVGMSEWPYMKQIDKRATAKFFGVATSASKAGHAIFALVFAWWSFRYKTIRAPLVAGRLVAVVACAFYLGVEFVPEGRRFLMMGCYVLFGIASSASTTLKAYVVAVSTPKDRPRAFAFTSGAAIFSIIFGPLIQLTFTRIPYPGWTILPHVHFHVYSAPIWIASLTNFVAIFVILRYIKEDREKSNKPRKPLFSMKELHEKLGKMQSSGLDWTLVVLCWTMKLVQTVSHSTLSTVMSILLMAVYGWTGTFTVRILSILMGGIGVASIVVLCAYLFFGLGDIVQQRYAFLFSLLVSFAFYVVTYPYPFTSEPVAFYNETTDTGCNREHYTWCSWGFAPHPGLLLGVLVVVNGVAAPTSHVSLDTIYSKVLGQRDQYVMQGAMIVVDDLIAVAAPIGAATLFADFGPPVLWTFNGLLFAVAILLWIGFLKNLRPYK